MYSTALVNIFGSENLNDGEQRLNIVKEMAKLGASKDVTEAELQIVNMVYNELFNDRLMAIRLEISKAVSKHSYASRHLIQQIAQDCASVSQFVLQYSNQLSEMDLVDLVTYGTHVKQIAIAHRNGLTETIIASLIEHGNFDVVFALVENLSANISPHAFRQIYINFGETAELRELLVKREDIPADLRELIAFDLSKELQSFAVNVKWLNKKQAENVAKKSHEITTINISTKIEEAEMVEFISKLSEEERLTPSLILRAVTTGHMKFFEFALSYLAQLPIKKIRSLLYNRNAASKNALYKRAHLPQDLFPIISISIMIYKDLIQTNSFDAEFAIKLFEKKMIKSVSEYYYEQAEVNQAYLQRVLDNYYSDLHEIRMVA